MERKNYRFFFNVFMLFFVLVALVGLSPTNLYANCEGGMAKLCICVSATDEPCKIENKRTWYITIFNCDGTVLEHCGKKYILMPTECGCRNIAVPPGCYYIKAVWGFKETEPGVYRVNHFTDAAIVQAVCGKTTCVRLFNPSVHRCGYIYANAVKDLIKQGAVKGPAGKRVIEGIWKLNDQIPKPKLKFMMGIEKEIQELRKEGKRVTKKKHKKKMK